MADKLTSGKWEQRAKEQEKETLERGR